MSNNSTFSDEYTIDDTTNNLSKQESENKIDALLDTIIINKIPFTYSENNNSEQLTLFEKAGEYLINENKHKDIISA